MDSQDEENEIIHEMDLDHATSASPTSWQDWARRSLEVASAWLSVRSNEELFKYGLLLLFIVSTVHWKNVIWFADLHTGKIEQLV